MRKFDEQRLYKAAKTITFDKIVLKCIEERARKEGTNVSKIVNMICRKIVLKDINYYKEKAKYHYIKFQEYKYMEDRAKDMREVQSGK